MLRKPGDAAQREWGLTDNLKNVRRWFCQNLFTAHTEAIPQARQFGQALPCGAQRILV